MVSTAGISPSDSHIAAIKKYPVPTSAKEVHSCLGLFSYFRRFVPQFSRIARPLQELLQKDTLFCFDERCYDAFCELRNRLIASPVLVIYNPKKTTELHTDASSKGFGAALMQKQTDGKYHPTAYFSKTTSAAESKYHSFELETLAIIYALRRFRVYLEGIPFKIITDCNSLTMTLEKKQVNPRIARWALELENFNYTIQHRGGNSMGHVDALSRCYAGTKVEIEELMKTQGAPVTRCTRRNDLDEIAKIADSYQLEDNNVQLPTVHQTVAMVDHNDVDFRLQVTQNRDPKILEIKSKLEKEKLDDFFLNDGLVYRKMTDDLRLFYVPAEMEENVIRLIHEKIGHQSVDKSCDQIRMHYWFPKMHSKVEKYIRNCIKCIMYATPTRSSERSLYSIPKEPVPFDTIHLDHFGPLPSLISKRKYLLVVIDAFTKFVKLYPVNSTSTTEVNASLDKYFNSYSRPRRVITDRGSCFSSLEITEYLRSHNIVQVRVAVASPQANGQVERVNRVITPMLGKLSEPISHADWSHKLMQVEYALNNTVHSTTKQTPSEMMFGVPQRGEIIDELTEYLDNKLANSRNLSSIRKDATNAIDRAQKYAAERAKSRFKPAKKYEVGDYIVMLNVDTTIGRNKKFVPKYRGPYVVRKKLGHDRYVIGDIENCQLTQLPYDGVVEANRIRKWLSPLGPIKIDHTTGIGNTASDDEEETYDAREDVTPTSRNLGALTDEEDDFEGFTEEEASNTVDRGRFGVRSAEL